MKRPECLCASLGVRCDEKGCDLALPPDGSDTVPGVPKRCHTCWLYHANPLGHKHLWDGMPELIQQFAKHNPGITIVHANAAGGPRHVAGPAPATARPLAEWPLMARLIARLRASPDKGLGDTIARHLSRLGADAFKRLHKRLTGQECGCQDRQARLNAIFPY